ncbi:MAG: Asp-tRNA(Asn)/Glu-tRNA(Gln) amidotransferase subunit GatA [Bdellovibrionales bacterium]
MNLEDIRISKIADLVKTKKVKAQEVTEFFMARAEKQNPSLNAYITLNERAIDEAKKVDEQVAQGKTLGKMAGVPVAVKDLLCTKDLRTTAASKILSNFIPPYSATVVEKLLAAGSIVVGKANLDEFAMGSSNENSAYGLVKNPWNLEMVPGGSSGGSAAAVSARLAAAAIGTDTGGSIRQPANFCGIVGVKPTYGRVSRYGIIAFASSLDQAGPMALDVRDAALMLEVISGHDTKDSTSSKKAVPEWSKNLKEDLKGYVVGVPKEYFGEGLNSEVEKVVNDMLAQLKVRGAEIREVSIPSIPYGVSVYYLVATSEASSNLARYDGVRFGPRPVVADVEELYKKSRGEGFGEEVKRRIMLGTFALSSGYYDAYYIKACKARRVIQNDFLKAFEECDVLVSPVTPEPAFKIGGQIKDPLAMYLNDIHTISTNLAGLPGMSVPGGFSQSGLPIGIQVTAKHFEEDKMLNVAYAIEQIANIGKRLPKHV